MPVPLTGGYQYHVARLNEAPFAARGYDTPPRDDLENLIDGI